MDSIPCNKRPLKHSQQRPVPVIMPMSRTQNEAVIFGGHGYAIQSVVFDHDADSQSTVVYKAHKLDANGQPMHYVTIKRATSLYANIQNEASVLKKLTVNGRDGESAADYVVKYIDSFESLHDFYLVTEYVESDMNLREFVNKCHEYILLDKLSFAEYAKVIKFVLWQLFRTVNAMHSLNISHSNLCAQNVRMLHVKFRCERDGKMSIDRQITIKVCGFGASRSQCLSLDYWSLGVLLFECLTNQALCLPLQLDANHINMTNVNVYLKANNLHRYFSHKSQSLLSQLLAGNATLHHPWFAAYSIQL